jgi:hypothetical protein
MLNETAIQNVESTCGYCKKKGKKKKNWTLFFTGRASDSVVHVHNDKGTVLDLEDVEDGATVNKIEWVLGNGCGRHLIGDAILHSGDISSAATYLHLSDGSTVQSTKRGTVSLKSQAVGVTN